MSPLSKLLLENSGRRLIVTIDDVNYLANRQENAEGDEIPLVPVPIASEILALWEMIVEKGPAEIPSSFEMIPDGTLVVSYPTPNSGQ